jgi:hypothetical protein
MRKQVVVFVFALLASVTPTSAQQIVYTNVPDGERINAIVRVVRVTTTAAPVPASITTTQVVPANWRAPIGVSSSVPSAGSTWGQTQVSRPVKPIQPLYIDGSYAGPSPSGNWTSVTHGRPVIDVNIVSTPRGASNGRTQSRRNSTSSSRRER